MMSKSITQDILNAFPSTSKKEWEAKATKDLKGKALDELTWEISEEIKQSPFYTAEDETAIDPSPLKQHQPDWQIGELYVVENAKTSNKHLLADLMHGLTAPVLQLSKSMSHVEIDSLFEGVGLSYIDTHFKAMDNNSFEAVQSFLHAQGNKANTYFELAAPDSKATRSVLVNAQKFYNGTEHTGDELKRAITAIKTLLQEATNPSLLASQFQCSFFVDNAYLLNIAKLRAFKLLYIQLLKELNLPISLPFVKVEFTPSAYGEDEQDNIIRATSMAMSAVMGGADHLIVRPTSETSRAKRLARNIQLILKYESGLHKVADPAAGSYYIESLTQKLINSVK